MLSSELAGTAAGILLASIIQNRHGGAILSNADKQKISINLLRALQEIHDIGIVHRDIKPENILVNLETFDVYVLDYGISRLITQKDTSSVGGGTLHWVAPEVFWSGNEKNTQQADIYSMGLSLRALNDNPQVHYAAYEDESYPNWRGKTDIPKCVAKRLDEYNLKRRVNPRQEATSSLNPVDQALMKMTDLSPKLRPNLSAMIHLLEEQMFEDKKFSDKQKIAYRAANQLRRDLVGLKTIPPSDIILTPENQLSNVLLCMQNCIISLKNSDPDENAIDVFIEALGIKEFETSRNYQDILDTAEHITKCMQNNLLTREHVLIRIQELKKLLLDNKTNLGFKERLFKEELADCVWLCKTKPEFSLTQMIKINNKFHKFNMKYQASSAPDTARIITGFTSAKFRETNNNYQQRNLNADAFLNQILDLSVSIEEPYSEQHARAIHICHVQIQILTAKVHHENKTKPKPIAKLAALYALKNNIKDNPDEPLDSILKRTSNMCPILANHGKLYIDILAAFFHDDNKNLPAGHIGFKTKINNNLGTFDEIMRWRRGPFSLLSSLVPAFFNPIESLQALADIKKLTEEPLDVYKN